MTIRVLYPRYLDAKSNPISAIFKGIAKHLDPKEFEGIGLGKNYEELPEHISLINPNPLRLYYLKTIFDNYDIIHTIPTSMSKYAYLATKLRNPSLKLVITFEGIPSKKYYKAAKYLSSKANVNVAASEYIAKTNKEEYNIQMQYIPNGVDLEVFNPKNQDKKTKEKYDLKPPVFLFVGHLPKCRLIPVKLAKLFPDATFVIRGRKKYDEDIEKYIRDNDLRNVRFIKERLPREEALPKLYGSSDVFLFPSPREPFGMVTIEAMSSGLPVIGVNGGATPEIVENEKSGFLVENGDNVDEYEQYCRMFLDDPSLIKEMGKKARERVKKKFDVSIIAKQYQKIYEEVTET